MGSPFARLAWALITIFVTACSSNPPAPDDSAYLEAVAAHRRDIAAYMQGPDSPIPPARRDAFLPLPYFPPDPNFSVPASLNLAQERPVFEMPTSSGQPRRMQLVGTLRFTLQGQPMTLGAFIEEGETLNKLFVPFADATTGTDTYAAGRYLDIELTGTGIYTIDFNHAYNPYCAYNKSFECPFPPPSNRLAIPVRAGEMAPRDEA